MALVIFVVMGLFTLWFGGLMLRAVDILYKPSVKKWMQNRPTVWQHSKQKPPGKNDLLKRSNHGYGAIFLIYVFKTLLIGYLLYKV